jgi:predicted nucleic acid-binding protein
MTVLDAGVVIGALRGEPAGAEIVAFFARPSPPRLSTVNLAEIIDVLTRAKGVAVDRIELGLRRLVDAGMRLEPVTPSIAHRAGALRAAHFHARTTPVSIADCIALATAIELLLPLATTDRALADVARGEGVVVEAVPNSGGRRP